MAHTILVDTPTYEIQNTDLKITIFKDNNRHGAIKVSRGDIEWVPSGYTYGFKVSWSDFDKFMQENGSRS
jgi:hypothetical protein